MCVNREVRKNAPKPNCIQSYIVSKKYLKVSFCNYSCNFRVYNGDRKIKKGDAIVAYDNTYRTTLICIDSYDGKIPRGRLYNAFLENGVEFNGTIDLLQNMERLLEEIKIPQGFAERRTFLQREAFRQQFTEENIKRGKRATFSLRLLFRQNASWQGSIEWHEGKSDESFRSVLELLLLIDSALSDENST